jgi:hypothetical protein
MRLRSIALPVAIACATAVALPSPAQSASSQCSVVMPTKVAIGAATVTTPIRVASNCAANDVDMAHWGLEHSSGRGYTPLDFVVSVGDTSQRLQWFDDDPMGTWTTAPEAARTAADDMLTQNRATTRIKYASRLATRVTRTSKGLSWAVTATQWSGRSHAYVGRPRVSVGLFHKATGSTTWKYVKAVRTSTTGRAKVSLGALKPGSYRLSVAETPTVWAAYSSSVRGKI